VKSERRSRLRRPPAEPRSTYTEWWWSPSPTISRTIPAGYSSFENLVTVEVDPGPGSGYVWAHQFRIVGGGGGQVGLAAPAQPTGNGSGRTAVFSISNTQPEGAHKPAAASGMGGAAWESRVPFEWQVDRQYMLQVWTDRAGSWSALVSDPDGGRRTAIGQTQVPPEWRGLDTWSVVSTEYHGGPVANCGHLARSSALFGVPTADGGRVIPDQSQSRLGPGNCDGSRVETVAGGVRHVMGG